MRSTCLCRLSECAAFLHHFPSSQIPLGRVILGELSISSSLSSMSEMLAGLMPKEILLPVFASLPRLHRVRRTRFDFSFPFCFLIFSAFVTPYFDPVEGST